jgi:hypothetical protein
VLALWLAGMGGLALVAGSMPRWGLLTLSIVIVFGPWLVYVTALFGAGKWGHALTAAARRDERQSGA